MTWRTIMRWTEFAWHVAVLLFLMGAFSPIWRQSATTDANPLTGDPSTRAILLIAFWENILRLLGQLRTSVYIDFKSPWAYLPGGWLFLSALWSTAPEVSVRRATDMALVTLLESGTGNIVYWVLLAYFCLAASVTYGQQAQLLGKPAEIAHG